MTNLTRGQEFTHEGKTYTFTQYWFSNVSKQTYVVARRNGATYNIPVGA